MSADTRASFLTSLKNLEVQLQTNKRDLAEIANKRPQIPQLQLVIQRVNELAAKYGAEKKKLDELRSSAGKLQSASTGPLEQRREALVKQLDVLRRQNDTKLRDLNTIGQAAQKALDDAQRETNRVRAELNAYEKLLDTRINDLIAEYVQITGSVASMNQNVEQAIQKMRKWLTDIGS